MSTMKTRIAHVTQDELLQRYKKAFRFYTNDRNWFPIEIIKGIGENEIRLTIRFKKKRVYDGGGEK